MKRIIMILEILQTVVCTDIEDKEEADAPFIEKSEDT